MKLNTTPPQALVIHCGDPRFQLAFNEFKTQTLGLPEGTYVPLVIPGSIGGLTLQTLMPKNFKILKEQIGLLYQSYPVSRVVLINHEGCRSYAHVLEKLRAVIPRGVITERQVQDLRLASSLFCQLLQRTPAQLNVELYMARIEKDSEIVFEDVLKEKKV